jgi:hypothetical protein
MGARPSRSSDLLSAFSKEGFQANAFSLFSGGAFSILSG